MTADAEPAPAARRPRVSRWTRARRWLWAQVPFVAVVVVLGAALAYLALWGSHWRRGVALVSLALFMAGFFRLVLPEQRAGMLAMRGRWRDTLCYVALGGGILAAAIRLH